VEAVDIEKPLYQIEATALLSNFSQISGLSVFTNYWTIKTANVSFLINFEAIYVITKKPINYLKGITRSNLGPH